MPAKGSIGRSVLKIHFFIESGLKMIQSKTRYGIFIQKYSFNKVKNIQYNCSLKNNEENYSNSKMIKDRQYAQRLQLHLFSWGGYVRCLKPKNGHW